MITKFHYDFNEKKRKAKKGLFQRELTWINLQLWIYYEHSKFPMLHGITERFQWVREAAGKFHINKGSDTTTAENLQTNKDQSQ